jgi:hypothetical protein
LIGNPQNQIIHLILVDRNPELEYKGIMVISLIAKPYFAGQRVRESSWISESERTTFGMVY